MQQIRGVGLEILLDEERRELWINGICFSVAELRDVTSSRCYRRDFTFERNGRALTIRAQPEFGAWT